MYLITNLDLKTKRSVPPRMIGVKKWVFEYAHALKKSFFVVLRVALGLFISQLSLIARLDDHVLLQARNTAIRDGPRNRDELNQLTLPPFLQGARTSQAGPRGRGYSPPVQTCQLCFDNLL